MVRVIAFIVIAAVSIPLAKFCLKQTGRFMMIEVGSKRAYNPDFAVRELTPQEEEELKVALAQKYSYFMCGGQAFVFFSADGKYVLKLFKQRHFREPTHLNYIPFIDTYRKAKYAKQKRQLYREYGSYKLAFDELKEESALVYLHLNPTHHLKQKITLIDKLNIEHLLDLDTTDFIVQRRGVLTFDAIACAMEKGDVACARSVIAETIRFVTERCKRGYGDRDPCIATNCGILDGKMVKIDVGRLYHDPNRKLALFYKPELLRLTRPLRSHLAKHYPELVPYLDAKINHVMFYD